MKVLVLNLSLVPRCHIWSLLPAGPVPWARVPRKGAGGLLGNQERGSLSPPLAGRHGGPTATTLAGPRSPLPQRQPVQSTEQGLSLGRQDITGDHTQQEAHPTSVEKPKNTDKRKEKSHRNPSIMH